MYKENHPDLRRLVDTHLGANVGGASKVTFEKAKLEIIFAKTTLAKAIGPISMEKYLEISGELSEEIDPSVKIAVDMIDSYYIPLPSETINAGFARAKKESIAKLKSEASQLKYFSFKDYGVKRKKTAAAKKIRSTNFENVHVEKRKRTKAN